jgi:hypothetical protein
VAAVAAQFAAKVPQVVVTVAVNWVVPPAVTVPEAGLTDTLRMWSETVTVAVRVTLGDAWLVATT